LFEVTEGVQKLVTYFLALLELVREGLVNITQSVGYAPIHVRAVELV
jgi:chromatin segregation and condensation protein Rec8/ScpA/Scc1 (kleisin family)